MPFINALAEYSFARQCRRLYLCARSVRVRHAIGAVEGEYRVVGHQDVMCVQEGDVRSPHQGHFRGAEVLGMSEPAMSQRSRHGLPGGHVLHLADLVKRWGVSEGQLFMGLALRREDLVDPAVSIPVPTVVALIERARVLTREPALGMYLGFQMSVSAHGLVG